MGHDGARARAMVSGLFRAWAWGPGTGADRGPGMSRDVPGPDPGPEMAQIGPEVPRRGACDYYDL